MNTSPNSPQNATQSLQISPLSSIASGRKSQHAPSSQASEQMLIEARAHIAYLQCLLKDAAERMEECAYHFSPINGKTRKMLLSRISTHIEAAKVYRHAATNDHSPDAMSSIQNP